MKVRALRGVCIGVDRHLVAGDVEDLEPALTQYLTSIGAVEAVPDEPPPKAAVPEPEPQPSKQPEPPSVKKEK